MTIGEELLVAQIFGNSVNTPPAKPGALDCEPLDLVFGLGVTTTVLV